MSEAENMRGADVIRQLEEVLLDGGSHDAMLDALFAVAYRHFAEVWDEGVRACRDAEPYSASGSRSNPYREDAR